jgi:hypothetical protein
MKIGTQYPTTACYFIFIEHPDALVYDAPRTNIKDASSGAWGHASGLPHLLRTLTKAKDTNQGEVHVVGEGQTPTTA